MICCSRPGLTEALYILYIYIYVYEFFCFFLFFININCIYFNLLTIDNRRTKTMTNDRPDLSSEGAPDINKP
jgi:hypothetical protein